MTTTTNLINECREFDTSIYRNAAHANAGMTAKLQDAADLLEAQAKQIEQLRKDWKVVTHENGLLRPKIEALQAVEVAATNLVKAKGRYHTEQNYKTLETVLAARKGSV